MTNTLNQDQTFPIPEKPVADSVTITVLDVYSTNHNGFKEIYFDGEEGKDILYEDSKIKKQYKKYLSFSELNSVESIEFIEDYL